MQADGSTQGSEHVERIESSEGLDTQRLADPLQGSVEQSPVHGLNPLVAGSQHRNGNIAALLLIGLGLLVWLGGIMPDPGAITGGMVLFTIASCFLFFALWRRIYALVIPGSILAGLSIGVPFAELTNGISVVWGLALGFLGILFAGRVLFNVRSPWPVFPAVPLFAVGVIIAIANLGSFLSAGALWLPLLLMAVGVYIGWGRRTA